MLDIIGITLFAISLVFSPLSVINLVKIKNYLEDKYPTTYLIKYLKNTRFLRPLKIKQLYLDEIKNDPAIDKYFFWFSFFYRSWLVLFILSLIFILIYYLTK